MWWWAGWFVTVRRLAMSNFAFIFMVNCNKIMALGYQKLGRKAFLNKYVHSKLLKSFKKFKSFQFVWSTFKIATL